MEDYFEKLFADSDLRSARYRKGVLDHKNGIKYESSADPIWRDGYLASLLGEG